MRRFFSTFILIALIVPKTLYALEPSVRVELQNRLATAKIYSKNMTIDGKRFTNTSISLSNGRFFLNGKSVNGDKVEIESTGDEPIWVNGESYPGSITIKKTNSNRLLIVNKLPLEKYVEGILCGEMPAKWPIEALKAQAVTARTYALHKINQSRASHKDYDVKSTVEDQVYKGKNISPRIKAAVGNTRGIVLTYHDKLIQPKFHSSCGGETELSINVWGEKDISRRTKDPYCNGSPYNNWKITLSGNEISNKLKGHGFNPGIIKEIKLEEFDKGNRVAAISIHGTNQTIALTGNDFRKFVGYSKIKSTRFKIQPSAGSFVFIGSGFGHGVGMCQWGAKGMATQGSKYQNILDFYYPETKLKKWY